MGNRYEPRAQVRLSVTVYGIDADGNPFRQTANVCDVSRRGARLSGIGCLRGPGETIEVEYGGKKAKFFVVWVGLPGTEDDSHIGIRLLERNKCIWKLELPKPNNDDFEPQGKEPEAVWDLEKETLLDSVKEQNQEAQSSSVAFLLQQKELQERQTTGDRRRYRRYAVDGGAELRARSNDARTWGPLTDISASGCYVQMYVPPALGTELEMTLEVGAVRVLAEGVVKVVYPGLGVGIEFTNIADEYRQRLNELLAPPRITAGNLG
jgi:PilZ domain